MDNNSDEQASNPSRRRCSRLATALPSRIMTLNGNIHAVLLDLSLTGARIELPSDCYFAGDLRPGTGVELTWEQFDSFGAFVWVNCKDFRHICGIQFEDTITPKALIATRDLHDAFWAKGGFPHMAREVAKRFVAGRW